MRTVARFSAVIAAVCASAPWAGAQTNPVYVQFAPSSVKAVLYRPDAGPRPDTAVLIIHRVSNYLYHVAGTELSRRGYLVLTMNSRFDNNETAVLWEEIALDVKTGVEFLRDLPGIRRVLLFGHSGGGPVLSFYQAVAEQGLGYCTAPERLTDCGPELADLPRADGLILVDAGVGNPVGLLRSLNPAVFDESDARRIDPALDPFNVANGFNPAGPSTYSEEFQATYFAAQARRMRRLIERAAEQVRQLGLGDRAPFPDNDVLLIPRARGARLADFDPTLVTGTSRPQKLVRNDGRVVTEIVRPIRPFDAPDPAWNASFTSGAALYTLQSFLRTNAILATDSAEGIDWCSSNNSTRCALEHVTVPLLVMAMGGGTLIRDSEMLYDVAASPDKDFVVIEGASHVIDPCTECETRPGQFGNSVRNFFNYLDGWIDERF